jgi:hypothetical protein
MEYLSPTILSFILFFSPDFAGAHLGFFRIAGSLSLSSICFLMSIMQKHPKENKKSMPFWLYAYACPWLHPHLLVDLLHLHGKWQSHYSVLLLDKKDAIQDVSHLIMPD